LRQNRSNAFNLELLYDILIKVIGLWISTSKPRQSKNEASMTAEDFYVKNEASMTAEDFYVVIYDKPE